VLSTDPFPAGAFYHVAATYDGATFQLYVNGVLEGSAPLVTTINYDSAIPWVIGANNPPARGIGFSRTWNGIIDEAEIIGRALSASEIAALYDAGTAGNCPSPAICTTSSTTTTSTTSTTTTTTTSTTTTTLGVVGHLKCYKGKDDRSKARYTLDVVPAPGSSFPLQPGCALQVGAKQICVEVTEQNVDPPPPGGGPVIGPNAGSVLLSYKVKCPKQSGPQVTEADQLGSGSFAGSTVSRFLVPALPGPANDHFECFKVKDARPKATYTMDLLAGVAGFLDETGCTIKLGDATTATIASSVRDVIAPSPSGGASAAAPTRRLACRSP
jgi:hypothetical protein